MTDERIRTSRTEDTTGALKGGIRPLKVLFLSSDTGGGHRASAESLANQFKILYPGTTYDLLDVMAKDGVPPYNTLVDSYKHLSAHPSQWNLVYKLTNSRAMELVCDTHLKLMCERAIRKSIQEYNPDVVVSVHPMMTNVPVLSCAKIGEETGKHLPIFTVVTDLGSAHCLWFANGVDKMFIASDQIRNLAKERGKVPDEKLVQIGLPIRHQFAVQAELLGDRMSLAGQSYQQKVRSELGLPFVNRKTILVMGGGEGVGSLSNLVDALYNELSTQGIDALILVVCGRNELLKKNLEERNWDAVLVKMKEHKTRKLSDLTFSKCANLTPLISKKVDNIPPIGCIEGAVTQKLRKILSNSSLTVHNAVEDSEKVEECPDQEMVEAQDNGQGDKDKSHSCALSYVDKTDDQQETDNKVDVSGKDSTGLHFSDIRNLDEHANELYSANSEDNSDSDMVNLIRSDILGSVSVVGLGFVTKMADLMVAADVLVSKAGPGTIAEAAALSLPVLLTSFLPGQEEGNVDFVVNGKFGSFIADTNPADVAEEVAKWLIDENKMSQLSKAAKENGAPNAARDIVKSIGDLALRWKQINDDRERLDRAAEALRLGIEAFDAVTSEEDSRDVILDR